MEDNNEENRELPNASLARALRLHRIKDILNSERNAPIAMNTEHGVLGFQLIMSTLESYYMEVIPYMNDDAKEKELSRDLEFIKTLPTRMPILVMQHNQLAPKKERLEYLMKKMWEFESKLRKVEQTCEKKNQKTGEEW